MNFKLLSSSSTIRFADVAHQMLSFDQNIPSHRLVLRLIDTAWVQRLRAISQTGNTKLVYMFSEHSRFGHSLGVAYLTLMLMSSLKQRNKDMVEPYENAVAAASLLHDIGHCAPGSHLAEGIWSAASFSHHETITSRVIKGDNEIYNILKEASPMLPDLVCAVLNEEAEIPSWTKAIISGGGWNTDRGNWSIVDSAMCAVSYGRYNVDSLIDAFTLTPKGDLVLQENRLDALTHFFVARDSMYRQVYQHRVLQAADALTKQIIVRLRDIVSQSEKIEISDILKKKNIYNDSTMTNVLASKEYSKELKLEDIFSMTEYWWAYHLSRWRMCSDPILKDLSSRLLFRQLFKTIRLNSAPSNLSKEDKELTDRATDISETLGFNPRYYVHIISEKDKHRLKHETPPMVLLDNGNIVLASSIEPMIDQIVKRTDTERSWLAVPKEVKQKIGRLR